MDRQKLLKAILDRFNDATAWQREGFMKEAVRYMNDANLIVFANEIGIDTDALFSK